MKKATIQEEIMEATGKLLELANENCYNVISNNCKYILTEIDDSNFSNLQEIRRNRINLNLEKKPRSIENIVKEITALYSDLYDVNLHVFQSETENTIIDVRYYLKSKLNEEYKSQVVDNDPMLHIKIALPNFQEIPKVKFDINWELAKEKRSE